MGVKKVFAGFLLFLLVAGVLAYLFVPETLWRLIASVAGNETATEVLGFNPYNTTGNATRTPRPPTPPCSTPSYGTGTGTTSSYKSTGGACR